MRLHPRERLKQWTEQLVSDCRESLSVLLPMRAEEMEFLERLNEQGEISGELLTGDEGLQSIINSHPGLLWKAMNVRKHRGRSGELDEIS